MRTCWWVGLLVAGGVLLACDDDDDDYGGRYGGRGSDICRLQPEECAGEPGAWCDGDVDCGPGLFCCRQAENCGGGMCTASCGTDRDCPIEMLCEHGMCFYACNSDRDCAPDMSCEHGNTICEYE